MSSEDDDRYFDDLNNGGIWEKEPPRSRSVNQQHMPTNGSNHNMGGATNWSRPQSDDDYFRNQNETGGVWDSAPPSSRPVHHPVQRTYAAPIAPAPMPAPQRDDTETYFRDFSVFDQGARHQSEAPTVRIPGSLIDKLAAVAGNPNATRVEHDQHGGIRRMTGTLDAAPEQQHQRGSNQRWQDTNRQHGQNQHAPGGQPTNRGGGWSR